MSGAALYRDRLTIGLGILTGQTCAGSGLGVSDEYRAVVGIARAAESLGFDGVWLSEHHGAEDAYMPSLLPMLGAIAAVTKTIRLGTAIIIPALYHPLHLAEDVAVVDQLSQGRVILGLGLGWRRWEFEAFGVPFAERAGRTAETVNILRHAWSGDPAPFNGKYYQLPHVRVRPLPFAVGGPPIFLAGSKEKPIRRAARLGDGLFYSRSGPTAASVQPTFDHLHEALRWVEEERAGLNAAPFPLTLFVNAFVAKGDPWRIIGSGVDSQFRSYARWKKEDAGSPYSDADEKEAIRTGRMLMLAGEPEALAENLGLWVDEITRSRPLHLVVKMHYPGVGEDRTVEALELFARDVMPKLKARVKSAGNAAALSGAGAR